MKTTHTLLTNFIEDFKLGLRKDEVICFEATVIFNTGAVYRIILSEIQIVTIAYSNLTMLCLLNPRVIEEGIPDTIYFEEGKFSYDAQSLIYHDNNGIYDSYEVIITPTGRPCHPETILELTQTQIN